LIINKISADIMKTKEIKKLEEIEKSTNDPRLKESIKRKMDILKGDKTVLK